MADPCGIIGVLSVAAQITKALVDLGLDFKDAPTDIKSLLQELQTLKTTLSVSNSNLLLNDDFLTAFEGRNSAVLSQLGKDAFESDCRLLVDACHEELDQLLSDLTRRSRGHRVGWNRIKSAFLSKKTCETVDKLQRQCDMLNRLVAIDSAALNAATLVEVRDGRKAQEDREAAARHDKILDWLTPVNYAAQQHDFAGRRREGTGQWLLDSKEYCAWRDADKGSRALFCPGIPGAGKTIIASMVIEDLLTEFGDDDAVGIAYVYCNFRRHTEQKAEDLLSSLLKQLAHGKATLPDSVGSLYEKHSKHQSRPSLAELGATLTSVIGLYERAYVVVDALDESPWEERDTFLEIISKVKCESRVSVLATSRPEVLTHFTRCIDLHDTKEIRAVEGDILNYVNNRLDSTRRPRLSRFPELQDEIRRIIVEAADGM